MPTTREQREAIQKVFPGSTSFTKTATGEQFLKFQGRDIPFQQALSQAMATGATSQGDLAQGRTTVLTTTTPELQDIERQIRGIAGTTARLTGETGGALIPSFQEKFPIITSQFRRGGFNVAPPTAAPPVETRVRLQAPSTPQPTPTNLFEFYTQRGATLPSMSQRAAEYEDLGIGPAASYMAAGADNAAENQALLAALLKEERDAAPLSRMERTPIPDQLAPPLPEETLKVEEVVVEETPVERESFSDLQTFYSFLERQRVQSQADIQKTQKDLLEAFQAGRTGEVTRLEGELGVGPDRERLNQIRDLIAAETEAYVRDRDNLRAETLPEGLSRGHLQKLQRDRLSKMEIFQAEAQALSGNLAQAEKSIDRALELKFLTNAQFINTMNTTLRRMEGAASDKEKGQIEIMQSILNRQEDEQKEKIAAGKEMQKLFLKYGSQFVTPADITSDDVVFRLQETLERIGPEVERARALDIRGQEALIAGREDRGVGATPSPGFSDIDTEISFREELFTQKSRFTDYANPTEDEAFKATIRLRDLFAPSEVSDEAIKAAVGGPVVIEEEEETVDQGTRGATPSIYEMAMDWLGRY